MNSYAASESIVANPDERCNVSLNKLREMEELKTGWYYGEGKAPIPEAIRAVRRLLLKACSFGYANMDVFPMTNGEVRLSVYFADGYIELTPLKSGTVEAFGEVNGEVTVDEDCIDFETAIELLKELAPKSWSSYALSPGSSSSHISTASTVDAFGKMTEESRWSIYSASKEKGTRSTNMSVNTTVPLLTRNRFSYASSTQTYPRKMG